MIEIYIVLGIIWVGVALFIAASVGIDDADAYTICSILFWPISLCILIPGGLILGIIGAFRTVYRGFKGM